jgi:hypothetical protein
VTSASAPIVYGRQDARDSLARVNKSGSDFDDLRFRKRSLYPAELRTGPYFQVVSQPSKSVWHLLGIECFDHPMAFYTTWPQPSHPDFCSGGLGVGMPYCLARSFASLR